MHPILVDWGRFVAYLAVWGLVGTLVAGQLVFAGPLAWVEAFTLAVPLALLFGFVGLGAFWVCQAAPLQLSRIGRSFGTQLVAAAISAALWRAATRGYAALLERLDVFPGLAERLLRVAPRALPPVLRSRLGGPGRRLLFPLGWRSSSSTPPRGRASARARAQR